LSPPAAAEAATPLLRVLSPQHYTSGLLLQTRTRSPVVPFYSILTGTRTSLSIINKGKGS
ncbi:hypothetical protein J1N35_008285, partial [Gossypium stocksii]